MTFLRVSVPAVAAAKKKPTEEDKKMAEVMHKWKHEGLPAEEKQKGKKQRKVPKTEKGQKQAVAIALSYIDKKKKKSGSCG